MKFKKGDVVKSLIQGASSRYPDDTVEPGDTGVVLGRYRFWNEHTDSEDHKVFVKWDKKMGRHDCNELCQIEEHGWKIRDCSIELVKRPKRIKRLKHKNTRYDIAKRVVA